GRRRHCPAGGVRAGRLHDRRIHGEEPRCLDKPLDHPRASRGRLWRLWSYRAVRRGPPGTGGGGEAKTRGGMKGAGGQGVTEQEWAASTSPESMLESWYRTGRVNGRQVQLFAAACCRRLWHLLADERSRTAIEVLERSADGPVGAEEVRRTVEGAS